MFKIKSVPLIWSAGPNYYLNTKNHENRTFLSVFILLGEFGVNFTPFWGLKCSTLSRLATFGLLVLINTYIPKITKIVRFLSIFIPLGVWGKVYPILGVEMFNIKSMT